MQARILSMRKYVNSDFLHNTCSFFLYDWGINNEEDKSLTLRDNITGHNEFRMYVNVFRF